MPRERILPLMLAFGAVIVLTFFSGVWGAPQGPPSPADLPDPNIPQPQFFCGYCHVLTYPGIFQKSFDTWEKGKHNKTFCLQCHYPIREDGKSAKAPWEGARPESKHIPKEPPKRFSYLPLGGETIRTRPMITDASCMTADCHGKPDDKFKTKKIRFTEKVSFLHQPHLEKKNQIEGQKINCTNCHQHETELKHFEVTKASCHLCHFKNAKFNEGRSRCELCHVLPKKPIQTSGDKPITHEMLQKAQVPCGSCHFDLIEGSGGGEVKLYFDGKDLKSVLVLNAGRIKKENCLACHDQELELKEADKKKLMHREHVTKKTARCFDCHEPIKHTKADLTRPEEEKESKGNPNGLSMPYGCTTCHKDPHKYQRLLMMGPKLDEVPQTPDFMYKVRTNCLGCHVEMEKTEKGQEVLRASGKTCVRCHTKDHDKMLKDWKTELEKVMKETLEVEKEALEALSEAKAKLSKEKLAEAEELLQGGRGYLNMVKFGNGVHNKKYSMYLLDAAIVSFEDLLDLLEK